MFVCSLAQSVRMYPLQNGSFQTSMLPSTLFWCSFSSLMGRLSPPFKGAGDYKAPYLQTKWLVRFVLAVILITARRRLVAVGGGGVTRGDHVLSSVLWYTAAFPLITKPREMWILIPRRANDGVDVRACLDKDAVRGFFPDIKRERLLSRPSPQTETAADFEAFELPFGCNQRASAGKVRANEEFPSTLKTDPNTSKHWVVRWK